MNFSEVKVTGRGFKFYKFKDIYNRDSSIQESSFANEPALWLGIEEVGARMHLNIPLAKELVKLLNNFIETGKL